MGSDQKYLKDIESFFLKQRGTGVMLSARDYNLVLEWKKRGIPRDIVFKGISNALTSKPESIRHIYNCKKFVEELEVPASTEHGYNSESGRSDQKYHIERIIKKTEKLLASESDAKLAEHYRTYGKRVEKLLEQDDHVIFEQLQKLEKSFFDSFFNSLDQDQRHGLITEARSLIPKNTSFLNDSIRNDTVNAFRNEILEKKYKLVNIFEYD